MKDQIDLASGMGRKKWSAGLSGCREDQRSASSRSAVSTRAPLPAPSFLARRRASAGRISVPLRDFEKDLHERGPHDAG